jgi:nicotinate phosphoribosyltransferase
VLWEVPLMAIISELYFKMTNQLPKDVEEKAKYKALKFKELGADYSEFGTRRRFSADVHDKVVKTLLENSGECFKGSSNIYFAMKYDVTPIGTHPHEWFMYHAAHFGYRMANQIGLNKWVDVYQGDLGIALSDTFTTDSFFRSFTTQHAKLFDGVRWDSGDPLEFTEKTINFYNQNRIDPKMKTIVYSDSLNLTEVERIKKYVNGRIHDAYGIGTYLTNDVGVKPLNMVIKLVSVKTDQKHDFVPTIKLSDAIGKHTGSDSEIDLCMRMLGIKSN